MRGSRKGNQTWNHTEVLQMSDLKYVNFGGYIIIIIIHNYVCVTTLFLQWLEKGFLGYLSEWDEMVQGRENFTVAGKKKMTLSKDTLDGLRMTGVEVCL